MKKIESYEILESMHLDYMNNIKIRMPSIEDELAAENTICKRLITVCGGTGCQSSDSSLIIDKFNEEKNKMLVSLVAPMATDVEVMGIDEVFNHDFKSFNSNIKDLNKLVKDKIEFIPNDKKEIVTKKIESLNKEIEKLMKSL